MTGYFLMCWCKLSLPPAPPKASLVDSATEVFSEKFWPSSQISLSKFLGHKILNFPFKAFKWCPYVLAKSITKWLGAVLIHFNF